MYTYMQDRYIDRDRQRKTKKAKALSGRNNGHW